MTSAELNARPGWRFVWSHPAHAIAFCGGIGLAPAAPGTFGTLLAFPLHAALVAWLEAAAHFSVIVLLFAAGVWACGRAGRALGIHDHGGFVVDETVAFLLVLFLLPAGALWGAFAFLLFRLFDIAKPPPIGHFDRQLRGGFGVMFDDLLAAGYTLLVLAVFKALWL